ncbi:hypothetical protein B0T10DRAFT_420078 [Thelonectria olida]|uniref:CFEM domain-containing protein n=1 Tax=Thelonectria olida TaxID=1576542 RepID=A0A9P9ADQ5_9HYPO|nr:hypothetical protein B0T10DRAFT_420078 [Thelonectria olida]
MKYALVVMTLATAVHAQTHDDIPSCALPCLDGAIEENTSCSTTDYACVCENFASLFGAVAKCLIHACDSKTISMS